MVAPGGFSRQSPPANAPVVFEASPLILLDRLGYLPALRELHEKIVIPRAVSRELGSRPGMPASNVPDLESVEIREAQETFLRRVREGPPSTDPGEAEAIALALGERAMVIVDDLRPQVANAAGRYADVNTNARQLEVSCHAILTSPSAGETGSGE